jgi:hypothetical protein
MYVFSIIVRLFVLFLLAIVLSKEWKQADLLFFLNSFHVFINTFVNNFDIPDHAFTRSHFHCLRTWTQLQIWNMDLLTSWSILHVTLFQEINSGRKSVGVPRSSLDPSAPGPRHLSGKSQRSSLPPGKEILRMKTVKTVLHIYFFLEGFKPLKTSSGKNFHNAHGSSKSFDAK